MLFLNLSCEATVLYPYQVDDIKSISGTIERKGITDLIIIPATKPFDLKDTMFGSTGRLTATMLPLTAIALDPYIIPIDGENYVSVC